MREHFLKLKSNLELTATFASTISTQHNAVRAYLKNNFPTIKDTKLIGSLQRNTRINPGINGKFDIDLIVVMGEFYSWVPSGGVTPQSAMNELHSMVHGSDRYGAMDPVQDPPTITITYGNDVQTEFVPAYVDMIGRDRNGNHLGNLGRGYWVVKGNAWEMADYDFEADYITQQNNIAGGHLVPAIKMLKAIKNTHFSNLIDSFPLEITAAQVIPMAVLAKEILQTPVSYDDLLLGFFEDAPARLSGLIQIPGSKSMPITLAPVSVGALAQQFKRIADYIRWIKTRTTKSDMVEAWREVFGDYFPVTL